MICDLRRQTNFELSCCEVPRRYSSTVDFLAATDEMDPPVHAALRAAATSTLSCLSDRTLAFSPRIAISSKTGIWTHRGSNAGPSGANGAFYH